MGIGITELILIFLLVLLLFGAKKLPEVAKSLGVAMNEFKRAKDEIVNTPSKNSAKDVKSIEAEEIVVGNKNDIK